MNEKHCHDLLAGHALDALDGDDRVAAERHLANCDRCKAECEELRETLHACLGHAVVTTYPSPLVRTQFLARVALEIGPLAAAEMPAQPARPRPPLITQTQAPIPAPRQTVPMAPRQHYRWLLGGAAVPAIVAIVLGMLFMNTQSQLSDERSHLLASAFGVPHVAMPLKGIAVTHGMQGEVIMPTRGTSGLMLVSGMRAAPSGMTYQCWLYQQDHWINTGVLHPDGSGIAMMVFNRDTDLHKANRVAVTMEQAGRPTAPSKPMLLSTSL